MGHAIIHLRQRVALGKLQKQRLDRAGGIPVAFQIVNDHPLVKMAGGDIHPDMKIRRRRKIVALRDGLYQHITRQRVNQLELLGKRDKHIRRNRPKTRVVPAQQQLHARAFAGFPAHQRLAIDFKLIVGDTEINLPGETHASGGRKPGDIANQQAQQHRKRQLGRQIFQRQRVRRGAQQRHGERVAF